MNSGSDAAKKPRGLPADGGKEHRQDSDVIN